MHGDILHNFSSQQLVGTYSGPLNFAFLLTEAWISAGSLATQGPRPYPERLHIEGML